MFAVDAIGVVKEYGSLRAVDELSLQIPQGVICAVLGPNGAGKSTLLRLLTTLSRPSSGRILIMGVDSSRSPIAVRRMVGVVGQHSSADLEMSAVANLNLQARLYGLDKIKRGSRIEELLEMLSLTKVADFPARKYSGGTRRRLDIALGLVHSPRVLFLDEPTTGLDPEVRRSLWNEIRRLTMEDEISVILTTHYLEEAEQLAGYVSVMNRGKIVAYGSPAELRKELIQDTICFQLEEPASIGRAVSLLLSMSETHSISQSEGSLWVKVKNSESAAPSLIVALQKAGLFVNSMKLERASLESVYNALLEKHEPVAGNV